MSYGIQNCFFTLLNACLLSFLKLLPSQTLTNCQDSLGHFPLLPSVEKFRADLEGLLETVPDIHTADVSLVVAILRGPIVSIGGSGYWSLTQRWLYSTVRRPLKPQLFKGCPAMPRPAGLCVASRRSSALSSIRSSTRLHLSQQSICAGSGSSSGVDEVLRELTQSSTEASCTHPPAMPA